MHHALDLRILTGDIHCFNRKCGGEGWGGGLNFELKRYGPIFIVAYIMALSF